MSAKASVRLLVSALSAMAVTAAAGIVVQRWMSFELVGADDSVGSWALVVGILAGIGLVTAAMIGWPCAAIANRLPVSGAERFVAACLLAAAVATAAFHAVVPFPQAPADLAFVAALCLLFFAVLYAGPHRRRRDGKAGHAAGPLASDGS